MNLPPSSLIDLAAGRPLPVLNDWPTLVGSAADHRMGGLLWSAVETYGLKPDPASRESLRRVEVAAWARNRGLAEALVEIHRIALAAGIEVAAMKGVAAEARWFDRMGERPSFDIDLWVSPLHVHRIPELVETLQPSHSLLPSLPRMLARREIQSVDLGFAGLPVDLHIDPLKLELVRTQRPDLLWGRTETVGIQGVGQVKALDAEASLILFLIHLNKDRFRRLLGFVDIARILNSGTLDWEFITGFLDYEALTTPVAMALQRVESTLRVKFDSPLKPSSGLGARLWTIAWPRRLQLLGPEAKTKNRHRLFLIPVTGGRAPAAAVGWIKRLLPSSDLVDHYYPGIKGRYARRLVVGRWQRWVERRARRVSTRPMSNAVHHNGNIGDLPVISVVTPSYQQAPFLEATLRSVLDQDYPKLELIVMDGGSDDGSVEIISRYADRLAYWTSGPDGGQTPALVEGFKRATGDVLCWLNSDDVFEPNALWEVGTFFRDHPAARVVYGDSYWITPEGQPLRSKREHGFNRFIWMHDHDFIPQPSTFWRRDLYEQVGGLDPQYDLAMDADLFIRFADITKVHHVPRLWSRMRYYPEQKNRRLRAQSDAEGGRIRGRYLPSRPVIVRRIQRKAARTLRIGWKLLTGKYF